MTQNTKFLHSRRSRDRYRMDKESHYPTNHITLSGFSGNDNGDSKKLTVETVNNHIYFYADIDTDRCLALIQYLHYLDADIRSEHISRNLSPDNMTPIWLHICSNGGDVAMALAVADQIASIKTPVYTVVEGICASAATLLSISGAKRYILPNSIMMIHELSTMFFGSHTEFEIELSFQQILMQKITKFMESRTKMSYENLADVMKRDFWMDADKALENGFVDEIIRPHPTSSANK